MKALFDTLLLKKHRTRMGSKAHESHVSGEGAMYMSSNTALGKEFLTEALLYVSYLINRLSVVT